MIFTCTQAVGDGKVLTQTYEGFAGIVSGWKDPPKEAKYLCGVSIDGDIDLWWLENLDLALEELKRFYRSEHGNDPIDYKIFQEIKS